MANPQLEDGYIRIARELWQALTMLRIPGEAAQVFNAIIQKTYGWNKKEEAIPLSQFSLMTGLKRAKVCRAINTLLSMNLIITSPNKGTTPSPHNGTTITKYQINKDFDTWRGSPQKGTSPNKGTGGSPNKGNKVVPIKGHSKDIKDTSKDKKIYGCFLDFWNEKKIITHKKLDDPTKRILNTRLKTYSQLELQEAISNYAEVVHGAGLKYRWPETQKWTFYEFLKQENAYRKFLSEAKPLERFCLLGKPRAENGIVKCRQCKAEYSGSLYNECPECGAKN